MAQPASGFPNLLTSKGGATAARLPALFRDYHDILVTVTQKAAAALQKLDAMDGFVREMVSLVCPSCRDVCCRDKYGVHDLNDIIFMHALGLRPPSRPRTDGDMDPCRFLGSSGCILERSLRPFRCTWFFCDELLKVMERGRAKRYRLFVESFHEIIEFRKEMADEFFSIVPRIPFTPRE